MKVRLTIDGREAEVEAGRDLLSLCLEQGVDVPHFCWHGALGSVGACRMCAVTVKTGPDDPGRVEMACMTPAAEGMAVESAEPEAARFRAQVVEWLMLNHPHDCAVCEEGGACHLQDLTLASGHVCRRSHAPKRTHRNQDLGPLLTHEMNRCIGCWRCVRFYRDYAGGRDLDAFGAHDRLYFGRAADGPLESPFAGNLAEVCPTGVFVDKAWSAVYARPWDMTATPAVCAHCAVGCNVTLNARGGRLRRVANRYHGAINGFFLCDRGRFGPWAAEGPRLAARGAVGPLAGAVGLGSPRASLEGNYALRRLVGAARFFAGVTDAEAALVARMAALLAAGPALAASVKEIETADAALVLGEALTATAPRAALALRQAAQGASRALAAEKGVPAWLDQAARVAGEGRRSPVALVTPLPDALDDAATWALRRDPAGVGAFGRAVAAALRGEGTADAEAEAVAAALAAAEAPLVIAGAGLGVAGPVEAAAEIAAALGVRARLALFPPEAGSMGLALLGASAGAEAALAALEAAPGPLIVLENDLFERVPAPLVERLLAAATQVIALDHLETETTRRADVVVPVADLIEAAGTWINHEGRAQRGFAARPARAEAPAAWRALAALGATPAEATLDALLDALAAEFPALAPAATAAPRADAGPVARAPEGFSGRTADDRAGRIAEGTPPRDPDSALVWSMEGAHGAAASTALGGGAAARPGLHSVSAAYAAQQWIGGPLKGGDPGVSVLAPIPSAPIAEAAPGGDGLIALPLRDPFAASEIDRASAPLAARAPARIVALNPADAAALGLAAGDALRIDGRLAEGRLTLDPALPRGHVGVSRGRGGVRVRVEGAE